MRKDYKLAFDSSLMQYYVCLNWNAWFKPTQCPEPINAISHTKYKILGLWYKSVTFKYFSGTGSGIDGRCTDPENVPECADYYADNPDVIKSSASGRSAQPERNRNYY